MLLFVVITERSRLHDEFSITHGFTPVKHDHPLSVFEVDDAKSNNLLHAPKNKRWWIKIKPPSVTSNAVSCRAWWGPTEQWQILTTN